MVRPISDYNGTKCTGEGCNASGCYNAVVLTIIIAFGRRHRLSYLSLRYLCAAGHAAAGCVKECRTVGSKSASNLSLIIQKYLGTRYLLPRGTLCIGKWRYSDSRGTYL